MKEDNLYTIEKEKIIPILDEYKILKLTGEIIFDEEITINQDDIYVDNRIRITIEKDKFGVNVYSADYQKQCGLGYWTLSFTEKEFEEFGSIDNFINEVFILGTHNDRGTSIATGIMNDETIEEKFSYDMI